MSKPLYITTTLPYVNAEPHIGFALEAVQADILARWALLSGREVFFNTGTDEHGTKIFRKAADEGREVRDYVDEYAEKFRSLKEKLGLHESLHFIRTTDDKHIKAAQEMWKRCFEKGDIYKKKYKGLYCVADEAFVKETDLVDGKCPNHPTLGLQEIEEENYFFKLSNYKDKLKDYIKSGTVVPDWRGDEALAIIDGMDDFSISRERERLPWGIPVPGDESQVMYVWFDALTSYISTLGWPNGGDFEKFWEEGETLQLAGKDQVKFQSVIWQAMLLSAGLPNTKKIFYHGFINSGGQKMSKSIGNVIAPDDLIKNYGVDALRYYLARHVSTFEDSDVTPESFKEAYNGNLANGLGNLVSRIMKLAEDNLSEPVTPQSNTIPEEYIEAIGRFEIQKAMNIVWEMIGNLDKKIQDSKPWESKDRALISELALELYTIGRMLNPFMPETSAKIKESVKSNKKPGNPLFARKD